MTVAPYRPEPTNIGPHRRGGVLRVVVPTGATAFDPSCAPVSAAPFVRLHTRQLVTWQVARDVRDWQAVAPVPDLALEVPSTWNAGLGASHRSYVFHLRPDVRWDTPDRRRVTAHDVVRGFKRMCNPVRPSPSLAYFASTVRGLATFATEWAAEAAHQAGDASTLAAYQNGHEIPGVLALDDDTLVIELARPALDFVQMLALPAASAVPVEHDAFIPGSPEAAAQLCANGPYRVRRHRPGQWLELVRNPAWEPAADPYRRAEADRVELRLSDGTGRADVGPAGEGAEVSGAPAVGGLPAAEPVDGDGVLGWVLDPYLVLNLLDPIWADPRVRQAAALAVDKAAVAALYRRHRPGVPVRVAGSLIPPGNVGHGTTDPYPTPDGAGDPARARDLLASARRADGPPLILIHPHSGLGPEVAHACTTSLIRAGLPTRPVGLSDAAYAEALRRPAAAGGWQLAVASRVPDWLEHNGRVFVQAMLQATPVPGGANHGGYSSPEVDALIERALDVAEPWQAEATWQAAAERALADVAVVPILHRAPVTAPRQPDLVDEVRPLPPQGYAVDLTAVRPEVDR
ncbi:ABC transporter substrate-binding protein [Verrucosispora sp. WMMD573]|uniref:ABC transporter substrate-binding protein n=1 Tax=Verrucosispora sp. WMMD573 TaxID=3015149 RepID=UPI00248AC71C|nr:ABC transporter substrate-binding protein [Verrucosispora sp. WMMD573]WBB53753.1 ABC transporter substrate-binding protein [Verrucosispora sp. WMMD573]